MKIKVTVPREVNLKTLKVQAGIRYWEDTEVNGVDDEKGDLIPCRNGDVWCPEINVDTGQIINWEKGKTANVHYKVCDSGNYYVLGDKYEVVLSREDTYVPKCLCPEENGYGDYIIMQINSDGFIKGWKPDFQDFDETES